MCSGDLLAYLSLNFFLKRCSCTVLMLFCSNSAKKLHFWEIQLLCDQPTDGRRERLTDQSKNGILERFSTIMRQSPLYPHIYHKNIHIHNRRCPRQACRKRGNHFRHLRSSTRRRCCCFCYCSSNGSSWTSRPIFRYECRSFWLFPRRHLQAGKQNDVFRVTRVNWKSD